MSGRNFLKQTVESKRDNVFEAFLEATGNQRTQENELKFSATELIKNKHYINENAYFSKFNCTNKEDYIKKLQIQEINGGNMKLEMLKEYFNIWIAI